MRIVMLSQFYAPIIGGEERHVQDLSIELVQRGHEVMIVTLAQAEMPGLEIDRGVRIYRIPSTVQRADWLFHESARRHAPPLPDPEALWAIRQLIIREQPDIVHAHNWLLHSYLPLSLWHKIALIVSLHDYSLVCAKKRLMTQNQQCDGPGFKKCLVCACEHYGIVKGSITVLGNSVMGSFERAAVDLFLPVSRAVAIGNHLIDSQLPFEVIPNFIPDELETFPDSNDSLLAGLPDGDFLLFVGDLSGEKGVYVLLQAYAELKNAPPLVLIGRVCGDTPKQLPPNVLQFGVWPHSAVMEAWRRSSIAIIPSTWLEPFGIVAIEAMAAGRPTIASKTGGLTDIVIDGETGLLVPPGNVASLAQAMQRLIDNPDLRARMGQAAKKRSAEYRASVVVSQIEQAYASVLEIPRAAIASGNLGEEEIGY